MALSQGHLEELGSTIRKSYHISSQHIHIPCDVMPTTHIVCTIAHHLQYIYHNGVRRADLWRYWWSRGLPLVTYIIENTPELVTHKTENTPKLAKPMGLA